MRNIILNRMGNESLFSKALIDICSTPGDQLILAYGYLSLGVIKDESFIKAIETGFANNKKPKKIIIIGSYNNSYSEYIVAANYLKNKFKGIDLEVYIKPKYHKKIAIKRNCDETKKEIYEKSEVIKAIIGSSNITEPAYSSNNKYLNQEVDVFMFNSFKIDILSIQNTIQNLYKSNKSYESKAKLTNNIIDEINLLNNRNSTSINFRLDLELDDIIYEIDNATSNGFIEVFNNELKAYNMDIDSLLEIILKNEDNYIVKSALEIFFIMIGHDIIDKYNNEEEYKEKTANLQIKYICEILAEESIKSKDNYKLKIKDIINNKLKNDSALYKMLSEKNIKTIYNKNNIDKDFHTKSKLNVEEVNGYETFKLVISYRLDYNKLKEIKSES